ncbi:MAG: hypothetical protein AB8B64_04585 [Granulosicoccus sp.]
MRLCLLLFSCFLGLFATGSHAQDEKAQAEAQVEIPSVPMDESTLRATRLDEIARLLQRKTEQRDQIQQLLIGAGDNALTQERSTLTNLNRDIARLSSTFEAIALGSTDISLLNPVQDENTDWRQDLIDILNPLVDSLKSVTERPRQLAELREDIFQIRAKLEIAQEALAELQGISLDTLDEVATSRVTQLVDKWVGEIEQLEQELLVSNSQLERLTADQDSFFEGVWPATREFLLGRGLTLIISMAAAVLAWGLMRFLWWFYTTRFTTKVLRRTKTWFRLLEYSFYFLTTLVTFVAVLAVLYIREDLLLIALSLLLIFGAVLSFRQFLPSYIREARLLLNLGSVREDERVIYNGLPWQVMSLNLHSVLRNPALDGVIRLPLNTVSELVSRPVKNNLWFPSNRGDYVILPDGVLGQIKHQTPDLVEISIRGGMSMTYNTSDFYSINLINLSRDETFGVSVTFGLDYELQGISLTEIPQALEAEVQSVFQEAGYKKHLKSLLVELSSANTSSLDFILFATLSSKVAKDYYKFQRLLQQSCVAVSNKKGWTIPFPQLTVHQSAAVSKAVNDTLE